MAAKLGTWTSLDGTPALGDIAGIGDLLEAITPALGVIEQSLGVVQVAAEALDTILALTDPMAAVVFALVRAIEEILANFANTGLYFLPIAPTRLADVLHPYTTEVALTEAVSALSDALDPNRPQVTETGAYVGMICLAGANVWADFRSILDALDAIFGEGDGRSLWAELGALELRVRNAEVVPRDLRNARGAPWDWSVVRPFGLLPPVRDVYALLVALLDRLGSAGQGLGGLLSKATAILRERIAFIANLAAQLERLVEFVLALKEFFLQSQFLFFASANGGVNQIAEEWLNAPKQPNFQLCAGFVAMGTGVNPVNDFRKFMSFIGVLDEAIDSQLTQVERRIEAIRNGEA